VQHGCDRGLARRSDARRFLVVEVTIVVREIGRLKAEYSLRSASPRCRASETTSPSIGRTFTRRSEKT
jgi:hypothetical protein